MSFRHIVFPVDFSARSHGAATYVRAMADRCNAAVTLLNVVECLPAWAAASDGAYVAEFDLPTQIEDARRQLGIFAAEWFPGMAVTQFVENGDPGTCIAELAKTWSADLIMMPTHGRGRFRAALLGSVTAKVLHDAHCAVWTGVHLEKPPEPCHTDIRTLMCAIDLRHGCVNLVRCAARLASEWQGTVWLVHAVPGAEVRPEMYFDAPLENFLKDNARKRVAALQAEAGTSFGVCIEAGTVSTVIREASRQHNADLVLIGRGVINEFAGRLRTHAYGIMRDAPCPVLSIG